MVDQLKVCLAVATLLAVIFSFTSVIPTTSKSTKMIWSNRNRRNLNFGLKNITSNGQKEAVDKLLKLLRRHCIYRNHELIFILSGPGVGKSSIFYELELTIEKSYECKNNTCQCVTRDIDIKLGTSGYFKPAGTFCDSQYHDKTRGIGLTLDYINNFKHVLNEQNDRNLAEFYIHDHLCLKKLNLNFVHIVTGSIMSNEDIESFTNATEYKRFVENTARKLETYMSKHAPKLQIHIIILQPLNLEQVHKILTHHDMSHSYENVSYMHKDFVPRGTEFKKLGYCSN